MEPRSIISAAIFSISANLAAVTFLAPNPAMAETIAQSRSGCVRQTMYDAMGNIRRGMTAEAVAFACSNNRDVPGYVIIVGRK